MSTYVFAPDAFNADAALFPYLQAQRRGFNFFSGTEDPKPEGYAIGASELMFLPTCLDNVTLARINRTSLYGNAYSCADVLNDISGMLFDADLKGSVNLYRQNIQTEYVKMLSNILNKGEMYDNASKAATLNALRKVKDKLDKASSPDEQTKAHRANIQFLIDKALVIK